MFQVSHSICTFSVSGEFGLAEPEETLWSMPLDKRLASQLCLLLDYFINGNLWNVDKPFAVFISISFHCGKIHPLKTSGGIPSNTRNINKRTWKHTHSSLFKNHGSFCWAFGVTCFWFCRLTRSRNGTTKTFQWLPLANSLLAHHGLRQQPHQDFWDKRFGFACLPVGSQDYNGTV